MQVKNRLAPVGALIFLLSVTANGKGNDECNEAYDNALGTLESTSSAFIEYIDSVTISLKLALDIMKLDQIVIGESKDREKRILASLEALKKNKQWNPSIDDLNYKQTTVTNNLEAHFYALKILGDCRTEK